MFRRQNRQSAFLGNVKHGHNGSHPQEMDLELADCPGSLLECAELEMVLNSLARRMGRDPQIPEGECESSLDLLGVISALLDGMSQI